MEQIEIYFDNGRHSSLTNQVNQVKDKLQTILNAYNAMGIENPFSNKDIKEIFIKTPEEFLGEKVMDGDESSYKIGNLSISKSKLWDMIEKPTNFEQFINCVKELNTWAYENQQGNYMANMIANDKIAFDWFKINNSTIELTEEAIEWILNACRKYIKTEAQKDVYDSLNKIIEEVNKVKSITGYLDYKGFMQKAFNQPSPNHDISLNHEFVLNVKK